METSGAKFRTQAVPPKQFRILGYDPWLVIIVIVMIAFGLVMVYSASWDVSYRLYEDHNALFMRQVTNLFIGIVGLIIASRIPLQWIRRLALPIILFAITALVLVLLMAVGEGPRRSFLQGSIQPSELAKLAMIIYLAVWMESKEDKLTEWGYGLIPLVVMIGFLSGLILIQPDLSAAITIGIVALVLFYLAGATWSQSLAIALGSGLIGLLLVLVTNTGRQRWNEYVTGLLNVEEASYHVQRSLQAFFSGGLFGRGLGASREKFGYLPAPHTDSIFAVIGEEIGLIGAFLVIALFAILVIRGFRIAYSQPERLGLLLACGITFWIGLEAVVNMAVLLGLLPFAGNALPFFSYGGSSLVTTLAAVGLLLNVSRMKFVEARSKEHVATLSISRGDRRRRVSRLGRRRRTQRRL
ncbi:MAG: FtsW/RodA/SpoVE family cell cycle protein [Anaerolineales bacterium]|nr:FtsW/RodA/SpoVE family cell cycle protein [Anaerolineales bacterium]